MKSQAVRLLDVFVLGPLLVWAGGRSTLPGPLRVALAGAGLGTIVYNAHHYVAIRELGELVELDPHAQAVRLLDVVALGPAMIVAAGDDTLPRPARAVLGLGGALTVANNARNFVDRLGR